MPDGEVIPTVAEPTWNQFISDKLLLHVAYTFRMKSIQFNKSHAVKTSSIQSFHTNHTNEGNIIILIS